MKGWRNKQRTVLNIFKCGNPVICIAINESRKNFGLCKKGQEIASLQFNEFKKDNIEQFSFQFRNLKKEDEIQYLLFQSDRECYIVDCYSNKVAHRIDFTVQQISFQFKSHSFLKMQMDLFI
ncbi:unnamed protein product [Paramecium sonneborni]|uniref:Uncharacterized protein n=1 Tax=Paramecium sonneborni TaxID=65129 RepID=A0A8S1MP12_9CILI|nr:unnamed protein product [Paramecium sonneborni]